MIFDVEPLPDPTKFMKREGEPEKHARRRKHADMEAEYNAVTCVAVYMLLMSFSQKGINMLKEFQEHMEMKYPGGEYVVSEGFDDGELFMFLSASPLFRFWVYGFFVGFALMNVLILCSVELVQGALSKV